MAHQAVGVTSPALLSNLAAEQIEKRCTVPIIAKDVLARIAARADVIQRTGEFQMQRTGHAIDPLSLAEVIQRTGEFQTQRTGHAKRLIRLSYKVKR
jgi:hypothetical protein